MASNNATGDISSSETNNSLLQNAFIESKHLHENNINSWFSSVNFILSQSDMSNIVKSPHSVTKDHLIGSLSTTLKEAHEVKCKRDIFNDIDRSPTGGSSSNKLRTYRLFKSNYTFENYLVDVKNGKHRKSLTKLRISEHDLEIERGRYGVQS
jgi:hypothetical protein